MKRKLCVLTMTFILIFTAVMATACHKVDVLTSCDFSIENIVEMRYSSAPHAESAKGNIYAIDRENGEEDKFAIMAQAWAKLQKEEFLIGQVLIPTFAFEMGITTYYECKFKDGTSIKITKDYDRNIYFNDSKRSYRIKNYDAMREFHSNCKVIVDESERYLVGYIDPSIPEYGEDIRSGDLNSGE